MSEGISDILARLERLAQYDGPWTLLRREAALLQQRVKELHDRETRLDDVLVVALVGGSGVGKSTLLNALAGDELARTSEFRPCTSVPTVYHPPGARFAFNPEWKSVPGSALEHLAIVDTPDSDTIVREHRQIVIEVLQQCDLIMICADAEKYLDEATWSLLRPLRGERTMVCIETKANQAPSVREHWLQRLHEHGVEVAGYFRVNSRRTFDRKLSGRPTSDDEYDFQKLEEFLHRELTTDRIRRIKRSNAAGLLVKTVATLNERVASASERLEDVEKAISEAETAMTQESFNLVSQRLFAEPHLWTYALGREMSIRAKGLVGTLYRILEAVRSIPARLATFNLFRIRAGVGHRAASLLTDKALLEESFDLSSILLREKYASERSELGLLLAKAGFAQDQAIDGFEQFARVLNERVANVLRGPARDRIVRRARILTSWPATIAADAPPVAFIGVSGWNIVQEYFVGAIMGAGFFLHAGTVFGIILGVEVFLLSSFVHGFAWSARRAAVSDLRLALAGNRMAFQTERAALQEARELAAEIRALHDAVLGERESRRPLALLSPKKAAG